MKKCRSKYCEKTIRWRYKEDQQDRDEHENKETNKYLSKTQIQIQRSCDGETEAQGSAQFGPYVFVLLCFQCAYFLLFHNSQ